MKNETSMKNKKKNFIFFSFFLSVLLGIFYVSFFYDQNTKVTLPISVEVKEKSKKKTSLIQAFEKECLSELIQWCPEAATLHECLKKKQDLFSTRCQLLIQQMMPSS